MPSALVDISFGDADCTSVERAMETGVRQGDPDDSAVPRHRLFARNGEASEVL